MKKIYFLLSLIFSFHTRGMERPAQKRPPNLFCERKISISLPKVFGKKIIEKPVFIATPFARYDDLDETAESIEYFKEHEQSFMESLENVMAALTACLSNDGYIYLHNPKPLLTTNPHWHAMVQKKETYFMFDPKRESLILRWDMGEERGLGIDQVLYFRPGITKSKNDSALYRDIQIQFENSRISGKMPLKALLEVGEKTIKPWSLKKPDEEHIKDVRMLVQRYLLKQGSQKSLNLIELMEH